MEKMEVKMGNFFRIDGPFYKISMFVYYIFTLSFIWLIFSIPLITIGASTTALFYVIGKLIREENIESIPSAFWKSFKLNIKQAIIIWVIIMLVLYLIYFNITNIGILLGEIAKFIYPVYLFLIFEILIIVIYIFPLLSRYHITILNGFKLSLFIGNRHFLTTIECLLVFPGILLLLNINLLFIFGAIGVYGFWISYLVKDKIERYAVDID